MVPLRLLLRQRRPVHRGQARRSPDGSGGGGGGGRARGRRGRSREGGRLGRPRGRRGRRWCIYSRRRCPGRRRPRRLGRRGPGRWFRRLRDDGRGRREHHQRRGRRGSVAEEHIPDGVPEHVSEHHIRTRCRRLVRARRSRGRVHRAGLGRGVGDVRAVVMDARAVVMDVRAVVLRAAAELERTPGLSLCGARRGFVAAAPRLRALSRHRGGVFSALRRRRALRGRALSRGGRSVPRPCRVLGRGVRLRFGSEHRRLRLLDGHLRRRRRRDFLDSLAVQVRSHVECRDRRRRPRRVRSVRALRRRLEPPSSSPLLQDIHPLDVVSDEVGVIVRPPPRLQRREAVLCAQPDLLPGAREPPRESHAALG